MAEVRSQRVFKGSSHHTQGKESLDILFNDFIEGLDDELLEFVEDKNLKGKFWIIHSGHIKSKNIKFNRKRFI